jgi:hypothetical protein
VLVLAAAGPNAADIVAGACRRLSIGPDAVRPAIRHSVLSDQAGSHYSAVRENLLRVISIADLMQIVPAHDLSAYDGIPQLPARLTSVSAPEDFDHPH